MENNNVIYATRKLYRCPVCGFESVVGPGTARVVPGFEFSTLEGYLTETCPDCVWRFISRHLPQMEYVRSGLGLEENNEELYERQGII